MKSYIKLIITCLLFFCVLNSSSTDTCAPSYCPTSKNKIDFLIRSPFRLKDEQPKYCGMPGFDLYCNYSLGTLIQLPNNVVLRVLSIYYYLNQIVLSDPYDNCLPQKLVSLDLTYTPFNPDGITKEFWLYNCSGGDFYDQYDRIDCLSSSDYTVISTENEIINNSTISICKFIKILNVPVSHFSRDLSDISFTYLNWAGYIPPPPPGRNSYSGYAGSTTGLVLGLFGVAVAMVAIMCGCHRRCRMNINEEATSTTNSTTNLRTTSPVVVVGLDQVTIDSYPTVVVGDSGRLIKPDDDTCPICLSDYRPRETLKMLPECLHRFHADCIDQWLCSKGICPVCRTLPLRPS